jgi:hypothetical protein
MKPSLGDVNREGYLESGGKYVPISAEMQPSSFSLDIRLYGGDFYGA